MAAVIVRKVGVIGCGFVGSATAFALMQSGLFSEIVMIDADYAKAEGEALDISHGVPFLSRVTFTRATTMILPTRLSSLSPRERGRSPARPVWIW